MNQNSDRPVCIVTGGSLGIGQAICNKFSQQGYRVVNLDIEASKTDKQHVVWRYCDVAEKGEVSQAIEQAINDYGRIDTLVSNAGVHFSGSIENTSDEDFERVFAINVKGAIAATRAVLPIMKSRKTGVILYVASEQALVAKPNSFAYNLSKAALASMAKTTALDYAKYNIRANALCPGTIETPLYHNAIERYLASSGEDKQNVHAAEQAQQPLGRLGQPGEVAALAYFLASDDAAFITGSLQVIDGGYTTQ